MSDRSRGEEAAMPYRPASEPHAAGAAGVMRRHEAELMEIDGVEEVGLGDRTGHEVILAYVRDAAVAARLPREIEGVAVAAEVTGVVEAL